MSGEWYTQYRGLKRLQWVLIFGLVFTLLALFALLPSTPEQVLADNNTLTFQGQYTRFVNYAPDSYAEGVLR